ncbi:MAG: DUF3883 domain-containing protein [Ardenticatenaceae bacterium]|nr:DUF3883 domain-containing protein [Ardenticatenaceae bacterium]
MKIDDQQFENAYRGFVEYVTGKDGRLFTTFIESLYLKSEELDYKHRASERGKEALQRAHWDEWRATPGKIKDAVLATCDREICFNLVEHGERYGPETKDYRSLEDFKDRPVSEIEGQLYSLLKPESVDRATVAPRFDQFAGYLSKYGLGCTWRFVTYLLFLLDKELYFPVLPTLFDKVLAFHGFDHRMAYRKVTWANYQPLLNFADDLRCRLQERGHEPNSLVDIHSYMYVLGRHVVNKPPASDDVSEPNWEAIALARQSKGAAEARRREGTGLKGEQFVFEAEKKRLREYGRSDLAAQVRHVADEPVGYDIASFQINGEALHIEVKTTRNRADYPFWLTNREYEVAQNESNAWTVYRVFLSETGSTQIEELGNVIHTDDWHIQPDGYVVKKPESLF